METRAAIKQAILEVDSKAQVILFGSQARGEAHKHSDWDVLILTPNYVDLEVESVFRHALVPIEVEQGITISTFAYSLDNWHGLMMSSPLYEAIEKEGVVL